MNKYLTTNFVFLCFLIRWKFKTASPTIPPIAAVLESVAIIAAIRSAMKIVFRMACLFFIRSLIHCHLFLHKTIIAGNNAVRKYP